MSPSERSWPGNAPSRNRRASAASPKPAPHQHRCGHLVERERPRESRTWECEQGASSRFRMPWAAEGTDAVGRIPREPPGKLVNSGPVLRTIADRARPGWPRAAAPASAPTQAVPRGVTVAGLRVGGLSAEPARAADRGRFRAFDPGHLQGPELWIKPAKLGAGMSVRRGRQLGARRDPAQQHRAAGALFARQGGRRVVAPRQALRPRGRRRDGRGCLGAGPEFSPAKDGSRSTSGRCGLRSPQLLSDGTRAPLTLLTQPVAPKRTVADSGR